VPQYVESLAGRVQITSAALGRQHTLFLDASGQAWATGENKEGQCGLGTPLEEMARRQRQQWELGAFLQLTPGGGSGASSSGQGVVTSGGGAAAAAAQQRQAAAGGWAAAQQQQQQQLAYEQQQFDRSVEYFSQNSWQATNLKPFVEHRQRAAELDAAVAMWVLPAAVLHGGGCVLVANGLPGLLLLLPLWVPHTHFQVLSVYRLYCPACRYDGDLKSLVARQSAWQRFEAAKGAGG
jgi:hypothetical protein